MDQNLYDRISTAAEKNRDELTLSLSRLVSIPSVTGNEGKAQEYVKELYLKLGLKTVSFDPDIRKLRGHKAFVNIDAADDKYRGRPNVVGILEGSPGAKSLKLDGHVDTVPAEPLNEWTIPPWSGKVADGRLHGRGASDDKSGIIANYFALKCLLDAGIRPEGTVILESVVEEEDGGAGALASLLEGYTTDGMIVTDAGPGIFVATSGLNFAKVKVKGKSVHAGWAEFGVSAVLKMNKICEALAELDAKRGEELDYPLFMKTGKKVSCNLVIGTYHAGNWRSAVPGWAEIEIRVGSIPGETAAEVRKQVEETITRVANADDWLRENPPEVTWTRGPTAPWEQSPDHLFVRTYKTCAERAVGREVLVAGMSASADVRFAHDFGMQALLTGGIGANAHSPNEYVDLNSVVTLTKALAYFIVEWCGPKSA